MKKLLLSLSALMFMTGISFADSLVDVKELTFGENLLYNNCIPSFMYESTIMNDEYLTTLTLRELFFQFSYRGNFENIDIYSGGLSAMYFFSNKFFVDTSANIGYYSKHDESNYSDSESGLYTDLQCGIGADFTICDGGLYLFTKVNLAVSNICPFYYSFSIGIRTPILSLAGLGEGASRGSSIARGTSSNTSYSCTLNSSNIHKSFSKVQVKNSSNSTISCNGQNIWSGNSNTFYTDSVTISSNSRVDVTYYVDNYTLYVTVD